MKAYKWSRWFKVKPNKKKNGLIEPTYIRASYKKNVLYCSTIGIKNIILVYLNDGRTVYAKEYTTLKDIIEEYSFLTY